MKLYGNRLDELDAILGPHVETLRSIYDNTIEQTDQADTVPVIQYNRRYAGRERSVFRLLTRTPIELEPATFNAEDSAYVSIWLMDALGITNEQLSREATFYHAMTLLVAHQTGMTVDETFHDILQRKRDIIDVDKQCISSLEERMFTISKQAGPAGRRQWGKGVGNPQYGFNPYFDATEYWIDESVKFTVDDERLVRTCLVYKVNSFINLAFFLKSEGWSDGSFVASKRVGFFDSELIP